MTTLAMGDEFLEAFGRLPVKARTKVKEFTRKFRDDPKQASIHYEPIQNAYDDRLRSVRIGLDYRAILFAPERGDAFVLLWVDHHDEAYRWASKRRVDVSRVTGALQVYRVIEEAPIAVSSIADAPTGGRFTTLDDAALELIGVPPVLIPAVRGVYTDHDLDNLVAYLPRETAEILTGVAAGMSLEEAIDDSAAGEAQIEVNVEDVAAALQRPVSSKSFRLIDDEFDLDAALAYPLDKWRVFLHPMQHGLAYREQSGSMSVTGGAGTGKTVVAMHRVAALVRSHVPRGEQVLFTTFTTNLADDISANLCKILTPDEVERVTVRGIVTLAMDVVRQSGESIKLADGKTVNELLTEALTKVHTGLPRDFFKAEWRDVIVAQGIADMEAYLVATRSGRGVTLRRSERRKIWPVFDALRSALRVRGLHESREIVRHARQLVDQRGSPRFAAVVVDEVQDFDSDSLRFVRALAGPAHDNDLFLVGDAHQRIYGQPVALSSCGINIRGRKSKHLRINYRTTDAILRFALQSLGGDTYDDLDSGETSSAGETSLRQGVRPTIRNFATAHDERAFVVREVRKLIEEQGVPPESVCIMARTHSILDDGFRRSLSDAGIESVQIVREGAPERSAVRMTTMHRAKGLEFPHVFLVSVNDEVVPLQTDDLRSDDLVVARNALKQERCLFYVATSRARDTLSISSNGKMSRFIVSSA